MLNTIQKISQFFAIPCDTLHIRQSFVTDAGLLDKEEVKKKVNQSRYRPEVPRGFQEVKVPRLHDNGPGWR